MGSTLSVCGLGASHDNHDLQQNVRSFIFSVNGHASLFFSLDVTNGWLLMHADVREGEDDGAAFAY